MNVKSKWRVDWTNWTNALGLILLLRVILGAWGAWVSLVFPNTAWEKSVAVWPPNLLSGDWWHRFWISPWMRWDYEYYENIVVRGYDLHDGTLAFHPLFPLLAKPFTWLTGNAQLSLLIVSTIACWISCVVLARYVAKFYAPQFPVAVQNSVVQGAAWALMLGPIGWILLAPYTESTFLAPCIGALWAMRERRWWLAGALTAVAVLARQQGLVLLLPMAWEMWREKDAETHFRWGDIFSLSLPIFAYASYSMYRVLVVGEVENGSMSEILKSWLVSPSTRIVLPGSGLSAPWTPYIGTLLFIQKYPREFSLWVNWLLGWAMAGLGIWACQYMKPRPHRLEIIYSLLIIAAALCFYSCPYLSLPRHVFLAWLLPIAIAIIGARSGRTRWILEAMAITGLFLFSAYVRHGWVP